MMFQTATKSISIYQVKIADVEGKFKMTCEVNQIEKNVLRTLRNPKYKQRIEHYEHLRGVDMHDYDEKLLLPVDLIFGDECNLLIQDTRVGDDGTPVAERTMLG